MQYEEGMNDVAESNSTIDDVCSTDTQEDESAAKVRECRRGPEITGWQERKRMEGVEMMDECILNRVVRARSFCVDLGVRDSCRE